MFSTYKQSPHCLELKRCFLFCFMCWQGGRRVSGWVVFENFLQLFNFLVHKMSEMWLTGTTVSGSLSQNKEGHLKTNVGSTAMTTNNQDELKNEKVNAE